MHLLRREPSEELCDISVGYLFRLFKRLAEHHLSKRRTRRNSACTAKSLEFSLRNSTILTKFKLELESVATSQRSDGRSTVWILNSTHIPRIAEMIHHFFRIIPHMSVNYTKIEPLYSNKKVGILGENYRILLLARPKHLEQECHIGYLLANKQGN